MAIGHSGSYPGTFLETFYKRAVRGLIFKAGCVKQVAFLLGCGLMQDALAFPVRVLSLIPLRVESLD